MPDVSNINRMLGMIVGDDAEALVAGSFDEAGRSHQAVYTDREERVVALCDFDMPAAVGLGCSLSMIPQAGAEGMLASKELSANANANLYEVMNIFSGLFMDDHTPHLRLVKLEDSEFSPDVEGSGSQAVYRLALGRYGGGTLRFRAV